MNHWSFYVLCIRVPLLKWRLGIRLIIRVRGGDFMQIGAAPMQLQTLQVLDDVEDQLPEESPLTIRVNGEGLVTLMCSRTKLTYLVAGFLYLQGVINSSSEIACLRVCDQDLVADVTTTLPCNLDNFRKKTIITSGCTGGVMSQSDHLKPIDKDIDTAISVNQIFRLSKKLYNQAEGYRSTGGTHSSALSIDGEQLLAHAEDIGRHNTIDKLAGFCAIRGFASRGGIIVSTGRISSEMVAKAAKMEVPILISRTSPTTLSVNLAEKLGITLVGYARAGKFKIYTYPWRIKN